ncbi:MAG TPA: glycosyltransferase family 4 protein, partial [Blastocatellia bacterium]
SIIQQAHPDARLVVAGAGKERRALERLALALRLKQTTFTGRVEPDRMRELYDCADIYLNSSNIDNMPGSILESFACGLPVVTTNAGGIPYIVRHEETGLMVDRNDHQALAAAAMRLLKDRELARKIILNARAECHKYQWSSVRNQWIDLYADIVGGSSTVASASTAPPALAQAATATVNHQTYLKESAGQGVRQ